jgi:type III pantothenate kinase
MNILAIDAGNTRIKWGLHDGQGWVITGAVGKLETIRLRDTWKHIPAPDSIVISNVAGELIRSELNVLMSKWRMNPIWISSQTSQNGVINGYEQPEKLGSDRWAALIGARHLHSGAAIVVMAGTAMTIDALSSDGRFLGGLILPGLDMMAESLSTKTAGIRVERGKFQTFPNTTRNAVWSAAIQASAGAIDRMHDTLVRAGEESPVTLLSGGGADILEPHLYAPLARVENLVLEGLVHIVSNTATVTL